MFTQNENIELLDQTEFYSKINSKHSDILREDDAEIHNNYQCSNRIELKTRSQNRLVFDNCTFNRLVILLNDGNKIEFENCEIGSLYISGSGGELSFKQFQGENVEIENLGRSNVSFGDFPEEGIEIDHFKLNNSITHSQIQILSDKMTELRFNLSSSSTNNWINTHVYCDRLILYGSVDKENELDISARINEELVLSNYIGHQNIRLHVTLINAKMKILRSRPDLTIEYLFLRDSVAAIDKSYLDGIRYRSIVWPTNLASLFIDTDGLFESKNSARAMRTMCSANNDIVYTRKFEILELDYRNQELGWLSETLSEKLPLFISKITNDFGRSWSQPLILLSLLSPVLYFLGYYGLSESNLFFGRFWQTLALAFNGGFWNFLLPTHSIESAFGMIDPSKNLGYLYFFDLVQRIVSGFLIFQLIGAFRFHFSK